MPPVIRELNMHFLAHSLSTLPAFAGYMALALGLTALYAIVYTAITPQPEWSLLRQGNLSAALAFGGSLLGFVIPLASAIAHSGSLLDCAVWGCIALIVQILAFFLIRLLLPQLPSQIEADKPGPATAAAIFFLAIGILNAACLVY
jgi:putative membrane protein